MVPPVIDEALVVLYSPSVLAVANLNAASEELLDSVSCGPIGLRIGAGGRPRRDAGGLSYRSSDSDFAIRNRITDSAETY